MKSLHCDRSLCRKSTEGNTDYIYLSRCIEVAGHYSRVKRLVSTINPAKLRQLIDKLETIAGLQQGFEELDAGQTHPATKSSRLRQAQ